jgi:hypothetical protein
VNSCIDPVTGSACSLCCRTHSIRALAKPAGEWCRHAMRGEAGRHGCAIHTTKPHECAAFRCLWLVDPQLPPEMQPSRCHVAFGPVDPHDRNIMHAHVDPDFPEAWRAQPVYGYLVAMNLRRKTVMIHVNGADPIVMEPNRLPYIAAGLAGRGQQRVVARL